MSISNLSLNSPIMVLGAGRLGAHLAYHLLHCGVTDFALWNRSPLTALRRASLQQLGLSSKQLLQGRLPRPQLSRTRLLLLTVADDALETMAQRLAHEVHLPAGCTVLHCSGALTSESLHTLHEQQITTGSAHPLQSFSGRPRPDALMGCWLALEGASQAIADGAVIAQWLGCRTVQLSCEGKVHYHTAAVIASNLLIALASRAVDEMMVATDPHLNRDECLELLLPLIEGTVNNLGAVGLPAALTGPVSRGDIGVVQRHLQAIAAHWPEQGSCSQVEVYRALSLTALDLARNQGLPEKEANDLEKLLQNRVLVRDDKATE